MKKLGPICLRANMAKMAGRINTLVNLAKMANPFVGGSERFLSRITSQLSGTGRKRHFQILLHKKSENKIFLTLDIKIVLTKGLC